MTRRPVARAGLLAAAALIAAGCGSEGSSDDSAQLPADVAEDLAAQSDAVEATLGRGDGCTAREQAIALRQDVKRRIEDGQVPAELRAEMRQRANELVRDIECVRPQPPPPPPPPPSEDYEEEDD